jgi:hypothetical protein
MKFKGCEIKEIENYTISITNNQCIKFALKYISYYLADEILPYNGSIWVAPEVKKGTTLNILIVELKGMLILSINGVDHLKMNSSKFHNVQLTKEAYGDIHCSFFKEMHLSKVSGYGYLQGRR